MFGSNVSRGRVCIHGKGTEFETLDLLRRWDYTMDNWKHLSDHGVRAREFAVLSSSQAVCSRSGRGTAHFPSVNALPLFALRLSIYHNTIRLLNATQYRSRLFKMARDNVTPTTIAIPRTVSIPADANAPSLLTTLPPELRNRIYEILFKSDDPVMVHDIKA